MNINDMTACERMAAEAWWEWKALDAEAARCMKMQREDEKITAAKRS